MPQRRGDGPVSTANAHMLGLLGLQVQGDLGPWTIYTDRKGRKKWFLYSPPTKPPTPRQITHRQRFKTAQANWSTLTKAEKENLELAVIRASLCMTGQNLFISAQLKHMNTSLQAIARQTKLTLPTAPDI